MFLLHTVVPPVPFHRFLFFSASSGGESSFLTVWPQKIQPCRAAAPSTRTYGAQRRTGWARAISLRATESVRDASRFSSSSNKCIASSNKCLTTSNNVC